MAGPVPPAARRWVSADKDGRLPQSVMQHLAEQDEVDALAPVEIEFSAQAVWLHNLTPAWTRIPTIVLTRADGKVIHTETTSSRTQVKAVFSEPVAGTMTLR